MGTKRRMGTVLRSVAVIAAGGMSFGGLAAYSLFPNNHWLGAAYGALSGAIQGVVLAFVVTGGEVLLPRTRLGRRLERSPFLVTLLAKTLVYGTLILLMVESRVGRWIAAYAIFGSEAPNVVLRPGQLPVQVTMGVLFIVMFVAVVLIQMGGLVGGSTLRNVLLGRYHRSHVEDRFFLFVDIVGSTPLAERLGPSSVHEFLNRVFQIASDPIDDHGGEVYQYVGDEVVVTWTLTEGRIAARPIACYFAIEKALRAVADDFKRDFGAAPHLRAALHAGPVITGEVGGSRRAIVFHGDVMNTASRLESATRDLQRSFLASEDALHRLDGAGAYSMTDLGRQALRGRSEPVRVYAVEAVAG